MAQDEDDSFIREVNEELRRENARALWGRYGPVIIGAAVAMVLATAAYQIYSYWTAQKAGQISETMLEALTQADEAHYDDAFTLLGEVEKTGFGSYPTLAALRKAALLAEKGEKDAAIAAFDAIAGASDTPQSLKNIALIRAAYLLVDNASFEDMLARVGSLGLDGEPMRLAAREILGLAAWKAGKIEQATDYFNSVMTDGQAGGTGFQNRSRMMLELIKGRYPAAES